MQNLLPSSIVQLPKPRTSNFRSQVAVEDLSSFLDTKRAKIGCSKIENLPSVGELFKVPLSNGEEAFFPANLTCTSLRFSKHGNPTRSIFLFQISLQSLSSSPIGLSIHRPTSRPSKNIENFLLFLVPQRGSDVPLSTV